MTVWGQSMVKGKPPRVHVLKRQPLYDREVVGGAVTETSFFSDPRRFADGRAKTRSDTNMSQSGCLGHPLEYDIVQVAVYPTRGDPEYAEKYHRFACSDTLFRLVFGGNTTLFELPMALMKPMNQSPYVKDTDTGKLMQIVVKSGKVEAYPAYEGPSDPKVLWHDAPMLSPRWHSVLTRDREGKLVARHIDSVESFRVEMKAARHGKGGEEVEVYVAFEGWLWATP